VYLDQLNNLKAAVEKCRLEEEMIRKISLESRRNEGNSFTSFTDLEDSYSSQQSCEFLRVLEGDMIDESLPLQTIEKIKMLSEGKAREERLYKTKNNGTNKNRTIFNNSVREQSEVVGVTEI
jgi:hypothetical protein